MNLHLRLGRARHSAPATAPLEPSTSSRLLASVPPLAPVVPLPRDRTRFAEPRLTTPFEDWCERAGVHPEAWEAWTAYLSETTPGA